MQFDVKKFLEPTERAEKEDGNLITLNSGVANLLVCCRSHYPQRI